jgi:hypothetical protein
MNGPLCVNCDSNSLRSAVMKEKSHGKSKKNTQLAEVTCSGDRRLARGICARANADTRVYPSIRHSSRPDY